MTSISEARFWPSVKIFHGENAPKKIFDWRHKTFVEERSFLMSDRLTCENDQKGCHILLESDDGSRVIGATHVMFAEESDFSRHTGIDPKHLNDGVYSSRSFVTPDARHRGYFSLLIYLAMRWARMHGRTSYFGYMEAGDPPIRKMLAPTDLLNVPTRSVSGGNGQTYPVYPGYGSVDQALFRCYRTLSKNLKEFVNTNLIPDELEQTIRAGIEDFYSNDWFKQVYSGCASRRQYAAVLTNLHHYVRWTTRLLARVVAETNCADLRDHYIEHLNGEINHEKLIAMDLYNLGYDTEYWLNQSSPDPAIFSFMAIQQSLASFERDPNLFLIVPFVAEGLSAMLSKDFIAAFDTCASNWGFKQSKTVSNFLRSHLHTDGGQNGHWQAIRPLISRYIEGEFAMQRALSIAKALLASQRQAYDSIAKMLDPLSSAISGINYQTATSSDRKTKDLSKSA